MTCRVSRNQNYQISTVTISKFQGGKRKAWRVHVFRTTDLKLHTNLDWTSQKLAENSVGLHRSSREKTLSSYEHRRKNGVMGGENGEKWKKKKYFFVSTNNNIVHRLSGRRHHIAYLAVHSFAVLVYLQTEFKEGNELQQPMCLCFRNNRLPALGGR